jgi:hypothetical protein
LNQNLPRWRTGVVLEWEGNRAVVKAHLQDRFVSIAVIGDAAGRRRLLTVIRADLEQIQRSISKLQVAEQVPVPGHPGLVIAYKKLLALEANGISWSLSSYQFYEGSLPTTNATVTWSELHSFVVRFDNGITVDCSWDMSRVTWTKH